MAAFAIELHGCIKAGKKKVAVLLNPDLQARRRLSEDISGICGHGALGQNWFLETGSNSSHLPNIMANICW